MTCQSLMITCTCTMCNNVPAFGFTVCMKVSVLHVVLSTMCHVTSFFIFHLKADDTYIQLKKDLEYLDLKVGSSGSAFTFLHLSSSPSLLKA